MAFFAKNAQKDYFFIKIIWIYAKKVLSLPPISSFIAMMKWQGRDKLRIKLYVLPDTNRAPLLKK